MMKFVNRACLVFALVLCVIRPIVTSPLSEIKVSLMTEYDARVRAEKVAFLKLYGLNEQAVDTIPPKDLDQIKTSHDKMIEKELQQYKPSVTTPEVLADIKTVQRVAQQVLAESRIDRVEVLHASEFEKYDLGVMELYRTGVVYIKLNAIAHAKNLDLLADLLRHEASHIVHKDNLVADIMKCTAWCHSHDTHAQIQEKLHPFCQSYETRADVYTTIHSSGYAKHTLNNLFKDFPEDGPATHPKPSDRVALLEHIQARLDAAELVA